MDSKTKAGQKQGSHPKQSVHTPRPGTEQAQSGTSLAREESERVQVPKQGEHQRKEGVIKPGKR